MKLKYYLIITFVVFASIQLFLNLYLINNTQHQLFEKQLALVSAMEKTYILNSLDRLKDNTALITSRSALRQHIVTWNTTKNLAKLKQIEKIIQDTMAALPMIQAIYVYGKNHTLIASTGEPELTKHMADLALIKTIKLTPFKPNKQLSILAQAPLFFDNLQIGQMNIVYDSAFIQKIIEQSHGYKKTGESVLAVRDHNQDAVFITSLKKNNAPPFSVKIDKNDYRIPINHALNGDEIVLNGAIDYAGAPVIASTRFIEQLNLGLVVKMDVQEVNAIIRTNSTKLFLVHFYIVLGSVILYSLLSTYITHPLQNLAKNAHAIVNQEHSLAPSRNRIKEIRLLNNSIVDMADKLRQSNQEKTRLHLQQTRALKQQTLRDPLTGLYNRRYIDEQLQQEIQRAIRYCHPLSIAMLDLDHFKTINDSWGHDSGDLVLVTLANYLKNSTRTADTIARYGGEEFLLMMPEATADESLQLLDRIREGIAALQIELNDVSVSVTCSFGMACIQEGTLDDKSLLKKADDALYRAKRRGRNRVIWLN